MMLLALMVLLAIAYRQLAYLLNLGRTSVTQSAGINLGARAPDFNYLDGDGEARTFPPSGVPAVLMFTDPRCSSCDEAVHALQAVSQKSLSRDVHILVATDTQPEVVRAIGAFDDVMLDIGFVTTNVALTQYKASVAPFLLTIDEAGIVLSKGSATDEAGIRKLLQPILTKSTSNPDRLGVSATRKGESLSG